MSRLRNNTNRVICANELSYAETIDIQKYQFTDRWPLLEIYLDMKRALSAGDNRKSNLLREYAIEFYGDPCVTAFFSKLDKRRMQVVGGVV